MWLTTAWTVERDLIVVLAELAFIDMDLSTLQEVGPLNGLTLPASRTLFSVLFSFVSQVLKLEAGLTMQKVSHRLGDMSIHEDFTEALLEIDDAAQLLDNNDQKHIAEELKKTSSKADTYHTFALEFGAKQRELREASAAAAPKAKAKKGAPVVPRLPENGRIEQADAKAFLPPGAKLWKSRSNGGSWNCRIEPLPQVSRKLLKHGESEALFIVIQETWKTYVLINGYSSTTLPMQGVFTD